MSRKRKYKCKHFEYGFLMDRCKLTGADNYFDGLPCIKCKKYKADRKTILIEEL